MSITGYAPAVMKDPLKVMAQTFARRYKRMKAAEASFAEFTRQAWHIIEPGTEFQDGWHIDALCDHLQATVPNGRTPGLIRQLVVTMPPRSMKTIIISALFPAWVWIHHPHLRFLYASYADGLSSEHSEMTRTVVESEWYQSRWGKRVKLKRGDNNKTKFSTTQRGRRQSTSVGAKTTGLGGDFVIVDDPHNVLQAESDAIRERTVRWWTKAMSSRLNNPKTGVRIIVQQRVHEMDVAGVAINSGGYVHLNLPMEYEPTDYISPTGWRDPRTQPGELLWPDRFDEEFVAQKKVELGSYDYAAQYQQRPTPQEGGLIKRHWWGQYRARPDQVLGIVQSWDTGFKDGKNNDYSACTTFAYTRRDRFILDVYRGRLEFPDLERMRDQLYNRWRPNVVLIEDKASGQSLIQSTRRNTAIPVIAIPVESGKDKIVRVNEISPIVESGAVLLPEEAPWLDDFLHEFGSFPLGAHDDIVDSATQGIAWIDRKTRESSSWSGSWIPDDDEDDSWERRT